MIEFKEQVGNTHLLLIAVDNYQTETPLRAAVNGANRLKDILVEKYCVLENHVHLLKESDATTISILDEIKSYRPDVDSDRSLCEKDSLIIYYAGHGQHDEAARQSSIIPYETENTPKALSFEDIRAQFRAIQARHILFICDSCFSGGIFRSSQIRKYSDICYSIKSRQALTSGNLEIVGDISHNEQTAFNYYLTKFLEENSKPQLTATELYSGYRENVTRNTETSQQPIYSEIPNSDHETGGEFVFFLNPKFRKDPFDPIPIGFGALEKPLGDKLILADYLSQDIMPYYGWEEHCKTHPQSESLEENEFTSEEKLLEEVLKGNRPLVLAGGGGIGKTRLAIELGKKAQKQGWHSYFLHSNAIQDDLEKIIVAAKESQNRLLLIVDYLEHGHRNLDFDRIHRFIEQNKDIIKLIATCRASYLESSEALRPKKLNPNDCFILNLNPKTKTPYANWLESWIAAAVQSIKPTSIEEDVKIPAIAIILKYAQEKLPHTAINSEEKGWMAGLLKRSIEGHNSKITVDQFELGKLLASFPMSEDNFNSFYGHNIYRNIVLGLKNDGWISKNQERGHWELGHDLLCDYVLIDLFTNDIDLFETNLKNLVNFGKEHKTDHAVSTALGRITQDILAHLDQFQLLLLFEAVQDYFAEQSVDPELAKTVLHDCLLSVSLEVPEKMSVVFAMTRLSLEQIQELKDIFKEESHKFFELSKEFESDVFKLLINRFGQTPKYLIQCLDEWLDPKRELLEIRSSIKKVTNNPELMEVDLLFG